MHAGKKTAKSGPAKAAPTQGCKANIAAAAAPVTVQASAHANSKYTAAPAIPVDTPYSAESLSQALPQPLTPSPYLQLPSAVHAQQTFVQMLTQASQNNATTDAARWARHWCTGPDNRTTSELQHYAGIGEEEAFHLLELQQREALYGPSHPNLADSLSNLAILYNQSGAYDKAQPLYERALRIYETVLGPDHPDVAHTLTDLAVLHLEQASC